MSLQKMKLQRAKKDLESIIYRAEMTAEESGVSVREMLDEYIKEIRKDKPFHAKILSSIEKKIGSGQQRYRVYKGILPDDIVSLLKISEEKNIPPSSIIKEYAPIREKYNAINKMIKRGVMFPMGLFLALTLILGSTVDKFKEIAESGLVQFNPIAMFFMKNFYLINFSVFLIMILVFVLYPKKFPMLKKIYQKTDSLLALSTISVLFSLGYSSAEIIKPIITQFSLKIKRVTQDINGLVKVLYESKFINPIEGAELKVTMKHGDIEKAINQLKRKRNEELEDVKEMIGGVLKNLTLLVMALPVIMTLIVFMNLLISVSGQATKF